MTPVASMAALPVLLRARKGFGDAIYARPVVAAAAAASRVPVYLSTSWPELFADLPVRFVPQETQLTWSLRNRDRQLPGVWDDPPPRAQDVDLRHRWPLLATRSMPDQMADRAGVELWPMDLPPLPPCPVSAERIAVVRPVTVRGDWAHTARNPSPQYLLEASELLRDAGYHVVSVASIDPENEPYLGEPPFAHTRFDQGELAPLQLLALVKAAELVVAGPGWAVPAAIAARTPLVIIAGGAGGTNGPRALVPAGYRGEITWLFPSPYCDCSSRSHACPKEIPDFARRFKSALRPESAIPRAARKTLLPDCYCGETAAEPVTMNELPTVVCKSCGAQRQDVNKSLAEYAAWYKTDYFAGVYYHTYEQDQRVAQIRLDSYKIAAGSRLLDVGSGNNAFVDACVARGIDAVGQDLAQQALGPRTFVGALEAVAFPTESFDVVTCHDVLEHVPDPVAFLGEVRRVLRPGGTLFLDFPRFHHPSGRHHWKAVEHIWLLDEEHLAQLLKRSGFNVREVWNPIDSKVAIGATTEPLRKISILVPPGIGDTYWVLAKLPGLLRREGAEIADIHIQDSGGPKRTHPYVSNVALAALRDYLPLPAQHPLFQEAYHQNGRTVFPGAELGVDFFVSYNGVLRHGRSLEEVDADFGVDWRPRTFFSKEAVEAGDSMLAGGPYVVAYFVDHGMYKRWLREFSVKAIERLLDGLGRKGQRVVLIGAGWDKDAVGDQLGKRRGMINLVGETSFDQMYGLLARASAVVGFPAGCTLLAPSLGVPTVLLWNRFFDQRFWMNSVPTDSPYVALDTRGLTPESVIASVDRLRRSEVRPAPPARAAAKAPPGGEYGNIKTNILFGGP